jgi:hypothetical protein
MSSIRADDRLLAKDLGLFMEPVELWDADGKLLGLFVPANLERCKQAYAEAIAKTDWAEVERRRNDPRPGVPFEKVRSLLRQMEAEFERRKTAGLPPLTDDEAMALYRSMRDQPAPANGVTNPASRALEQDACASP